jgi:Taurine catabolism dioxygenase TauD, TfdA family
LSQLLTYETYETRVYPLQEKFKDHRIVQSLPSLAIKIEIMAPHAIEPIIPEIKDVAPPKKDTLPLPPKSRARLEKAGIDLSGGYPYRPARPLYLDDVYNIRNEDRPFTDAGSRADPEKKELLGAAKEVIHLTRHIGTEIVGLQLKDLNDNQKDELALLIAERSVVFFRDQDISPQQQKALGEHFGAIEIHVRRNNYFWCDWRY